MRLYSFQGRYGNDKICRTEQKDLKVGDLLVGKNDMFLALGDEVVRNSDKTKYRIAEKLSVHHKDFLGKEAVEMIHRMTHEYYTSYKNVVKLFVTGELADLFKKEIATKKKVEQTLIVYPDVRTMENTMGATDPSDKGVVILNGTSTQVQQDKAWRGIKTGHIHTLHCTYSQIFQDRKNLQNITLIDSHQRYYKNQQDPRYDTREVLDKMAALYEAKIDKKGLKIFAHCID